MTFVTKKQPSIFRFRKSMLHFRSPSECHKLNQPLYNRKVHEVLFVAAVQRSPYFWLMRLYGFFDAIITSHWLRLLDRLRSNPRNCSKLVARWQHCLHVDSPIQCGLSSAGNSTRAHITVCVKSAAYRCH